MHRLAYQMRGLRYYDVVAKQYLVVDEPLWKYDTLTIDEKELLITLALTHAELQSKQLNKLSMARIFGIVCEEYALLCPHASGVRDYSEWEEMSRFATESNISAPKRYYVCQSCLDRINV